MSSTEYKKNLKKKEKARWFYFFFN